MFRFLPLSNQRHFQSNIGFFSFRGEKYAVEHTHWNIIDDGFLVHGISNDLSYSMTVMSYFDSIDLVVGAITAIKCIRFHLFASSNILTQLVHDYSVNAI